MHVDAAGDVDRRGPSVAAVAIAGIAVSGLSVAVILPLTAAVTVLLIGTRPRPTLLAIVTVVTLVLAIAAGWTGQDRATRLVDRWLSRDPR